MKIITIASSGPKMSKAHEERQNKMLTELYKQYQKKPFDYAVVDYYEGDMAKVKTFTKNVKKSPIKNFFKKILKMIIK